MLKHWRVRQMASCGKRNTSENGVRSMHRAAVPLAADTAAHSELFGPPATCNGSERPRYGHE